MKNDRNVYRILALFSQFTVHMLVPIFMCSFIGYYIDKKCNTSWVFILAFFIGAIAGMRNMYILAQKVYDFKKKDPLEEDNDKS